MRGRVDGREKVGVEDGREKTIYGRESVNTVEFVLLVTSCRGHFSN